ncbi:MAG: hypothetical protein Q7J31_04565 [Syntrophales bacterium]|nr:hypothetical protein [Syntrophales bacterium]
MAHINNAEVLVPLIFGFFGFIMAYYLRRGLNMVIFALLLYAAFRALESLKFSPDWGAFHRLVNLLQELGRITLALISSMISMAGTVSLLLFLGGAIAGLVLNRRVA